MGLKTRLPGLEAGAASSLKTTNALVAQLKRIRKIAQTGSVRDLEKALEQAQQLAVATRGAVVAVKAGWRFDARVYMEAGSFTEEILAMASASGMTLQEQDGRVVSYPSLVRILPADEAVEIDRKRTREIRPSHVVAQLQSAQSRPTKFRAEPFLEALLKAYRYVVAEGGRQIGETVRLVDVYKVLTVLPGQSATYSVSEFVRDIYLLDESRVAESRDGLTLSLPAASGTRT